MSDIPQIDWERQTYRRRKKGDVSEVRSLLEDIERFPEFAAAFLKIRDNSGKLVPFVLNPIQMWFHFTFVVPKVLAGEPVRAVILKMRQSGISTYFQGLTYWYTLGHSHTDALLVGQDKISSQRIFRILLRYHTNFNKKNKIFPLYTLRRERVDMLEFDQPRNFMMKTKYFCPMCGARVDINAKARGKREFRSCPKCGWDSDQVRPEVYLDSRIEVLHADKGATKHGELGRGGTYQFVHGSEVAFWPYLTASLSSLISACHDVKDTMAFIETTANGYNEFHSFWSNMTDPMGNVVETDWQRCFIPWYWKTGYEIEVEGRESKCEFFSDYEEWLFERITEDETLRLLLQRDVTKEDVWRKILWRRKAVIDKCFGDEDYFKQEFPATDVEAFKFSGVSVFNQAAMTILERKVKSPVWNGSISYDKKNDDDKAPSIVTLSEEDRGRLKIWEQPDPLAQYVIGADVAEGKAVLGISEEKSKWDFSVGSVIKIGAEGEPLLKHVATWHGNSDPDQFGYLLVALAKMYHNAFLCWEINGPGRSLKIQIINTCRYRHYYKRREMDSITNRPTRKPGWRTTSASKADAISIAQRYVRDGDFVTQDSSLLSEMQAYSRIGENKYGAAKGHDDRVMATVIAMAAVDPIVYKLKRKAEEEKKRVEGKTPKRRKKKRSHGILGSEW